MVDPGHPWDADDAGAPARPAPGTPPAGEPSELPLVERQLKGRLPCLRCRYDLGGLSVLGVCPECGMPIRATILAVVDPYASELRPVRWRIPTAAGMMTWSLGALAAAILTWGVRVSDALAAVDLPGLGARRLAEAGTLCIVLSGIGAMALIRPHAGIPAWKSLAAAGAVLLFAPLAWIHAWLHLAHDPAFLAPYLETELPDPWRTGARLLTAGLIASILIGQRPVFRVLSARSVLLRSGRVERQTLYAVLVTVGVAATGDLIHLAGAAAGGVVQQVASTLGTLLIAVGSMLFSIGLAGIVIDVFRIVPVILEPAPSLEDVLGDR